MKTLTQKQKQKQKQQEVQQVQALQQQLNAQQRIARKVQAEKWLVEDGFYKRD